MDPRMATNTKRNQPTLLVIAAAVMDNQTGAGAARRGTETCHALKSAHAGRRRSARSDGADNNKVNPALLIPPVSARIRKTEPVVEQVPLCSPITDPQQNGCRGRPDQWHNCRTGRRLRRLQFQCVLPATGARPSRVAPGGDFLLAAFDQASLATIFAVG
jgi:hypothetical protein